MSIMLGTKDKEEQSNMVPVLRVYGPRGGYHQSTMTHQGPLGDVH